MNQQLEEGTAAVTRLTEKFLHNVLGVSEDCKVSVILEPGSGDGVVSGIISGKAIFSLDLAMHAFPIGTGTESGSIEAG